jgi:ribonuclease HI
LKSRGDRDKKKQREELPSSSHTTSDSKMDEMAKMLKTLTSEMARLKMETKQPSRPTQEGGYKNPNQFRRPNNVPQIFPRERRNQEDQKVLPPFQNNAVEEVEEIDDTEEDSTVHLNDTELPPTHLTQQDYEDALILNQFEEEDVEEISQKEPKRKKYDLRSRSNGSKVDIPVQTKKTNAPVKSGFSKEGSGIKIDQQQKQPVKVSTTEVKESEKQVSSFSLENEINKIKIPIPLVELMKTDPFRKSVLKALQPPAHVTFSDTINLEDENPAITIGPHIEDRSDASPPFYISLNIHEKILHNCLMDSGASHNVMPKVVMDELGLDITKPYLDLYSFDSRKVKCLGVIKDMVVTLSQLPMKSVVLDVIVADIPPKFGMLLSRSWAKKVGGTLQMDLSYATIPVFGGEHRRLYREVRLAYLVSDHENPSNHPIYVVEDELGSSIFHIGDQIVETSVRKIIPAAEENTENLVWKMFFDGACSKEGSGAGIVFISPTKEVIPLSYKLEFDTTNNISEYEALLLGLKAAKNMGIDKIYVFGDSELIIHQIKNIYQTKQQRLKQYRNEVWDFVDNLFLAFNITFIHKNLNQQADSLALAASNFRTPIFPNLRFEIEVRHRPSIPDNIKNWQVFKDDQEIKRFLETIDEFSTISIDQDNENDDVEVHAANILQDNIVGHKIIELKTNHFPKGLVPLERLFDHNDVSKKYVIQTEEVEVVDCDISPDSNPRMVKLSRKLPEKQRDRYVNLMKQFSDVFSWSYEDLKVFDTEIMQHKIPLKPGSKPFKKKSRQFNPLLLPIIEKELKRLLNAKIIVPLRYSEWVANLVPVRKKNGEIRLCVDFRNLNRCSLKDNYPLPKMDHILQRVVGAKRISMLDGYSGYNQISVMEEDKKKTTFTTPWGTFMYEKMPFGLMNAGATFQRAMDITFIGEKDKFMVIYLDDIIVFSTSDDEHLQHLKQTFEKCRRYGISLNPKKSHFSMEEGKLLGHIVSPEGIKIDPERVKAIQQIDIPRNKKSIQSFIGKINFLRRFIPNFAEIIKHIIDMLKKDAEIKWIPEAKESFEKIKQDLIKAPVLIIPNYSKEFFIFSFASEDTIVVVLLQRNDQGYEQPISFFNKTLRDSELKYDIMEKQAYALVKALKSFRVYVLHSEITAYVPNSAVKEILVQPDCEGKRGKWITKILEYNLTINPTQLIKGQGLAKLMTESNCRAIGLHHFSNKSIEFIISG